MRNRDWGRHVSPELASNYKNRATITFAPSRDAGWGQRERLVRCLKPSSDAGLLLSSVTVVPGARIHGWSPLTTTFAVGTLA